MTELSLDDEHLITCVKNAYSMARSGLIDSDLQDLERSIVAGVEMGAASLTPEQRKSVSAEVLGRLYGRTKDDLVVEQNDEIEQERAEFEKLLMDREVR